MKRNLLLITVIVAAACLLVIYFAHNLGASMSAAFNEDNGFTGSASQEYISLFTPGSRDKLQNRQTYLSKVRNLVSVFGYDNKYLIIESKFNVLNNISLVDKVNEKDGHPENQYKK